MGMNYYAVDGDPCLSCGRADPTLHICKSFATFAGHLDWNDDYTEQVAKFHTWADWRKWLLSHRPTIEDECGQEMDLVAFIRRCDSAADPERVAARKAESEARGWWRDGEDWIDPAGYLFIGTEFS